MSSITDSTNSSISKLGDCVSPSTGLSNSAATKQLSAAHSLVDYPLSPLEHPPALKSTPPGSPLLPYPEDATTGDDPSPELFKTGAAVSTDHHIRTGTSPMPSSPTVLVTATPPLHFVYNPDLSSIDASTAARHHDPMPVNALLSSPPAFTHPQNLLLNHETQFSTEVLNPGPFKRKSVSVSESQSDDPASPAKRSRPESASLSATPNTIVINGVRFVQERSFALAAPGRFITASELNSLNNLGAVPHFDLPPSTSPATSGTPVHTHSAFQSFHHIDDVPGLGVPTCATPIVPAVPSPTKNGSGRRNDSANRLALIESAIREKLMKTPTRPSVPLRPTPSLHYQSPSPQCTPSSHLLSSPLDRSPFFAEPTAESASEPRDDDGLGPNGCLQVSLMDPLLCNSYRMIKNLRSVVLYPVGNDAAPSEDCDWESFSAVFKRLPSHQQRSLMNSVLFESRGGWFNPARADPSLLKLNSKNLPATISPILKPQFPALCLTTGIVQKCSIIQPSILHLGNGQTRTVREVLVKGFAQESQRAFAFFGKIFGFDSVSVAASAGVVSYSSMQLFQNQKKDDPNDFSPTKLARSYRPERYAESDPRLKLYGHFRLPVPFPSQILIFDGRRAATDLAFECEANQLHEIAINSYPLYQNGDADLPDGAIVTVGYTAHTYATKSHYRNVPIGLSLDLAFIVLLALPSDLRDPIPQPEMSSYSDVSPHIPHQTPSKSFTPVYTLSQPTSFSRFQHQSPTASAGRFSSPSNGSPFTRRTVNMHALSLGDIGPSRDVSDPSSPHHRSGIPIIHTARRRPIAMTPLEAELEAELDLEDDLSYLDCD